MGTGKTNAKWIRVSVDDMTPTLQAISASVSSAGNIGLTHEEDDVTAYSDGVHNVTLGHPEAPIILTGPFDNTATTGAYTVLAAIVGDLSITHTVTTEIGIRAAPTTGDPVFSGEYYCHSLKINGDDGTWTSEFVPASATAPAWSTI